MMDFDVKMNGSPPAAKQSFTEKDVAGGVWTGMTIKDILEKVDLFNITTDDGDAAADLKGKDVKPDISSKLSKQPAIKESGKRSVVASAAKPESAFLGPKIWKNPITLPMLSGNNGSGDAEFSIMNIDDFLNENNFDFDSISPPLPDEEILGLSKDRETKAQQLVQTQQSQMRRPNVMMSPGSISSDDSMDHEQTRYKPPPGADCSPQAEDATHGRTGKNPIPKGENGFLYAESKRAKQERERAEARKRKMEIPIDFAPEDLALATIPGADFDPKRRHFSADELRPQPIIRKRKKTYVPGEDKDDKYWERREKNNMAARRSREARRLKENQIALRTAYLEKENGALQVALDKSAAENERLKEENKRLKEALDSYENGLLSLN